MEIEKIAEGMFPFTNYTDREFRARWDGKEYIFPPNKTVPMLGMIGNATPEHLQFIRKKFARELGEREFYETDKFKKMNSEKAGYRPAPYVLNDLASHIQKCLEPLPVAKANVVSLPKDSEDNYRKDSKGKLVSRVVDGSESLVGNGTVMSE